MLVRTMPDHLSTAPLSRKLGFTKALEAALIAAPA